MAKRKTAAIQRYVAPAPRGGNMNLTVRVPRMAGGIAKRAKHHARRAVRSESFVPTLIGGFLLGLIDKSGMNFPTVAVLGRAGTIGGIAYLFRKSSPLARNVAHAGLAVAAYEFGKEGKVSGEGGVFTTI
jgi:hypothetical protein